MKIFTFFLGIVLLSTSLFAQTASDPKADKILKDSQSKFDKLADVTAQFKYTISNPNLKTPIIKQGKAILKKDKYMISFPDEEIYCNTKYIWVKLISDEEITKNCYEKDGPSIAKIYEIKDNSKLKYEGEEGDASKVTVFSNDKKADIWKTELWINKTSKLVDKAIMYARNGSKYAYEMSEIKTNSGVNDEVFNLDEKKYAAEDWIVTDLCEK